ncbi:cysteine desulfurase-like protein [Thermoleptolyngbya sp. M55_K2018_002]|uniref:cysteine desulfurase-like protein n=1 Tax=Thermoleptolyngbya sp. M55_K2018_002 TaxID=2747808 RepID=UPI0019ECF079|nr:cysteine desulfurase-like protein [Thermoleptolyngbya sp. M55_K2018_002]HIK40739.1 cysteine desulfurase-like protein [Thermoleptolyngbya sp. M55_K2018_002]
MLTTARPLQLDYVRAQFPALAGEWVFFDNAGGSQTLKRVADRISDYLLTTNVQLGASYDVSQQSTARVAEAAQAAAMLINAAEPGEVVMGGSTTLLLRILSLCLGQTFRPGDEIIVTNCDHESNIGCWLDLRKQGIIVKFWNLNPETLQLDLDTLAQLMTPRTRLVALTHVSNILGTINPIRQIANLVHERGAMICVDGVAYAPHRQVDVQALDVDFYVFSFYKVYGPHYALLYGKREHLLTMPGINHYFISQETIPYKFQPGNVNFELSYGAAGVVDYLSDLAVQHGSDRPASDLFGRLSEAFDRIAEHEAQLSDRLLSYLHSQPRVKLWGDPTADRDRRVPTIAFTVGQLNSATIPPQIDRHHIGIRYGDFYARRLIEDLGLAQQNGVVRVSMVHYNTLEECDRLIAALDPIIGS